MSGINIITKLKLVKLNDLQKIIVFDSLEECISLKNHLISFIKKNKRLVKDHGEDPELIINLKDIKNGKKNT